MPPPPSNEPRPSGSGTTTKLDQRYPVDGTAPLISKRELVVKWQEIEDVPESGEVSDHFWKDFDSLFGGLIVEQ